jgi:hypothetical protein
MENARTIAIISAGVWIVMFLATYGFLTMVFG